SPTPAPPGEQREPAPRPRAAFQDRPSDGTMGRTSPANVRGTCRPASWSAKVDPMANSLSQLLPRSLRGFLKDRLLARKYPMLTFGRDVHIKESKFGRHTQIADQVNVYKCTIGDYSYIEVGTVLAHATLGKFCSVAGGTYIGLGVH